MAVSVRVLLLAVLSITMGTFAAEEFVVHKKKKQPSTTVLKEECCRVSADCVAAVPAVLKTLADIQQDCVSLVTGALEGKSHSFCEQASKKELAVCLETLQALQRHMNAMQQKLSCAAATLHTQMAKK